MNTCKTCKWWSNLDGNDYGGPEYICNPMDPDTYELMQMPFIVRKCSSPKLVRFERPVESNGFAVVDGSQYYAALCTAENFGCILHELK